MKKLSLKSKILLGAILLGGTAAGAQVISKLPKMEEPRYNWTGAPNAPENPGQMLLDTSIADAKEHFGCEGTDQVCATGTLPEGGGSVTIRFD